MTHTDNATCKKMLVTSTRHISERTISLLRATDPYDWPYGGGPIGKSGFFYRSMKRNGAGSPLPTDLFEVLSWAADKEYDGVTFSSTGPVIEQFAVYRESGAYGDTLMEQTPPGHLDYMHSQRATAFKALSADGHTFEVTPDSIAAALTAALDAVERYLMARDDGGLGLWEIPLPALQRMADIATIYFGKRSYKTGEWDDSIAAAAELQRLLGFELERSKNMPLNLQQRLARSLAEQIRYLLQEPV